MWSGSFVSVRTSRPKPGRTCQAGTLRRPRSRLSRARPARRPSRVVRVREEFDSSFVVQTPDQPALSRGLGAVLENKGEHFGELAFDNEACTAVGKIVDDASKLHSPEHDGAGLIDGLSN